VTAVAPSASRQFSMAQLVEQTGVAAPTVRYYLSAGLLPPPIKVAANRFLYDERHVEVVRLVRLLRERRGLSIEAIGRALPELLPDLLARPEGGAFRPEMWGQLLIAHTEPPRGPSPAERLLEAGLVAFSSSGTAEVSVDDVCRAAGIAKGSFYRHFASKDSLVAACGLEAGRRSGIAFAELCGTDFVDRTRATGLLATAMGPYLPLLLDLAALATERRPSYGAVLRQLVQEIREAMTPHLRLAPGERTRDVFGAALVEGISRVIGDPGAPGGLSELAGDDVSEPFGTLEESAQQVR
jgi:AcrR family transcriptional regulator